MAKPYAQTVRDNDRDDAAHDAALDAEGKLSDEYLRSLTDETIIDTVADWLTGDKDVTDRRETAKMLVDAYGDQIGPKGRRITLLALAGDWAWEAFEPGFEAWRDNHG